MKHRHLITHSSLEMEILLRGAIFQSTSFLLPIILETQTCSMSLKIVPEDQTMEAFKILQEQETVCQMEFQFKA